MTKQETAARPQIVVRRIPFSFDEGVNPVWHPTQHEWAHMFNGASLTMPFLEPFLIKTVREAIKHVDDEALKEEVNGFMGQEGAHYKNHRRLNEILKQHYPELAEVEAEMAEDYARFQSKSLRWRLAYTAGFETMTMGVTEWLIADRSKLFSGADASVVSLILWHMVEETEHKNVAYDLYMHMYGDYWHKVWGLLCGSWHVAWSSRKAYIRMLKRDGRWNRIGSRLKVWSLVGQFLIKAGPAMIRSILPGYHPMKVKDPEWIAQWANAYEGLPEGRSPLLDTKNKDIPAQFA